MERLTVKTEKGWRLVPPEEMCEGEDLVYGAINRLAELEDKLESGQLVELSLKKQKFIYHLFKRKMYGVVSWCKRKITWVTYVGNIVRYGDDGLYFPTLEQAEARLKVLQAKKLKQ